MFLNFCYHALACAYLTFFSSFLLFLHLLQISLLCTPLCYSHLLFFFSFFIFFNFHFYTLATLTFSYFSPLLVQFCFFLSFKGKYFSSWIPLKELELELHLFPTAPTPGLLVKLGIFSPGCEQLWWKNRTNFTLGSMRKGGCKDDHEILFFHDFSFWTWY